MGLAPGTLFAGYRIERRLGAGGMGTVYLARHPRLPRSVALKILDAEAAKDSEYRARFEREADITVRLDHPNVVEIYDRGAEGDLLWIAMRFVAGSDVAHLIRGGLAPVRAVEILAQAAAGLDAAHRRGLLHRDVKPANLLVSQDDDGGDHVFVADFGIARSRDDTRLTAAGELTATLAYVAPEQIEGHEPDHRCDVYALGVTFYQMLTGTLPFPGLTPVALLQAHLLTPPPRPSEKVPGLPPGLDDVVRTALAKNPDDRFPDCRTMAESARAALGPADTAAQVHDHPPAHRTPPASHRTAPPHGGGPTPRDIASGPPGSVSAPHRSVPNTATGLRGSSAAPHGTVSDPRRSVPRPNGPNSGPYGTNSGPNSSISGPYGMNSGPNGSPPPPRDSARGPHAMASGQRLPTRLLAAAAIAACLSVVIVVVAVIIRSGTDSPGTGQPIPATTDTDSAPSTDAPPPTTTQTTAGAPVNIAWGRNGTLAGALAGFVPDTPAATGYQGSRCADITVLNNGGAPALECEQGNGIHWYAWSFRPSDPRRDTTYETNIDNATTREEPWQRESGSGRVRWTHYTETNTGLLTVVFDDPDRGWIVIDASWDGHTGQDLYDLWWSSAPL